MEKIHLVLAEDDEDDRLFFSQAVEQLGLNIALTCVQNGVELLEYLENPENKVPDLVFLDLNMPLKGGIACLIDIRKNTALKDLSIAIYSTSSSDQDLEDCLVHGANIYINKPTDFEILKSLLLKVITINHQYDGLTLSKENFLLVV
nr:response regulator [Cytophagales bacterium]